MWHEIAQYARRAPSPHNTQPTRLRVIDGTHAEVSFAPERGLPVGDPHGRFTYATFGIFVESLRIAAHARGYELDATFTEEPLPRGGSEHKVADLRLHAHGAPIADLDPDLLLQRRTNRHPYDARPVPPDVVAQLCEEARRHGHRFHVTSDPDAVQWVKLLNRDALYHDLEHDAYREELDRWLCYSDAEADRRGDGMSPGALVLPGWLMRGMIRHHWLLSAPVLKQLTGRIYLRTMTGISTVGWIQGDFVGPQDWTRAGAMMLRLWLILTRHGVEWQPYGSVITNDVARGRMVDLFGMSEGDSGHDMAWLLVRMGYSQQEPAESQRLPITEVVR